MVTSRQQCHMHVNIYHSAHVVFLINVCENYQLWYNILKKCFLKINQCKNIGAHTKSRIINSWKINTQSCKLEQLKLSSMHYKTAELEYHIRHCIKVHVYKKSHNAGSIT